MNSDGGQADAPLSEFNKMTRTEQSRPDPEEATRFSELCDYFESKRGLARIIVILIAVYKGKQRPVEIAKAAGLKGDNLLDYYLKRAVESGWLIHNRYKERYSLVHQLTGLFDSLFSEKARLNPSEFERILNAIKEEKTNKFSSKYEGVLRKFKEIEGKCVLSAAQFNYFIECASESHFIIHSRMTRILSERNLIRKNSYRLTLIGKEFWGAILKGVPSTGQLKEWGLLKEGWIEIENIKNYILERLPSKYKGNVNEFKGRTITPEEFQSRTLVLRRETGLIYPPFRELQDEFYGLLKNKDYEWVIKKTELEEWDINLRETPWLVREIRWGKKRRLRIQAVKWLWQNVAQDFIKLSNKAANRQMSIKRAEDLLIAEKDKRFFGYSDFEKFALIGLLQFYQKKGKDYEGILKEAGIYRKYCLLRETPWLVLKDIQWSKEKDIEAIRWAAYRDFPQKYKKMLKDSKVSLKKLVERMIKEKIKYRPITGFDKLGLGGIRHRYRNAFIAYNTAGVVEENPVFKEAPWFCLSMGNNYWRNIDNQYKAFKFIAEILGYRNIDGLKEAVGRRELSSRKLAAYRLESAWKEKGFLAILNEVSQYEEYERDKKTDLFAKALENAEVVLGGGKWSVISRIVGNEKIRRASLFEDYTSWRIASVLLNKLFALGFYNESKGLIKSGKGKTGIRALLYILYAARIVYYTSEENNGRISYIWYLKEENIAELAALPEVNNRIEGISAKEGNNPYRDQDMWQEATLARQNNNRLDGGSRKSQSRQVHREGKNGDGSIFTKDGGELEKTEASPNSQVRMFEGMRFQDLESLFGVELSAPAEFNLGSFVPTFYIESMAGQRLLRLLNLESGRRVLDIGFGDMVSQPLLMALKGLDVTAVEIDERYTKALTCLRDAYEEDIALSGGGIQIIKGSITSNQAKERLDSGWFDNIIILDVLNITYEMCKWVSQINCEEYYRGIVRKEEIKDAIGTILSAIKKQEGSTVYISEPHGKEIPELTVAFRDFNPSIFRVAKPILASIFRTKSDKLCFASGEWASLFNEVEDLVNQSVGEEVEALHDVVIKSREDTRDMEKKLRLYSNHAMIYRLSNTEQDGGEGIDAVKADKDFLIRPRGEIRRLSAAEKETNHDGGSILPLLSDTQGKIKNILVFCETAREGKLENTVLKRINSLCEHLDSDVNITVGLSDLTRASMGNCFSHLRGQYENNIELVESRSCLSPWANDSFYALEDKVLLKIPLNAYFGIFREDQRILNSPCWRRKQFKVMELDELFPISAAELITADNHIFIGPQAIQFYRQTMFPYEDNFTASTEDEDIIIKSFDKISEGREVIFVDTSQINIDLDLWFTYLGEKTVALADIKAIEELKETKQLLKEGFNFYSAKYYYLEEKLDGIERRLNSQGFKVIRIPLLPALHKDKRRLPMQTYNNCLLETFDGTKRVYLPKYEAIEELNRVAKGIYERQGFKVLEIEGLDYLALNEGSLRCSAKVLERYSDRDTQSGRSLDGGQEKSPGEELKEAD